MPEERLQKLLSQRGVTSRRKAEELIEQGKVKVDGRPASLGDKADPRRQVITVCGKRLTEEPVPVYIALHKPRGYVTTLSDEQERRCVAELVEDVGTRVFPVGRLDRQSEGLLLMTSDGAFAQAMMHPAAHLPKRYRVTLRGSVTPEQQQAFENGLLLDGRKTAPARFEILSSEPERSVVEIVLYEGRNRQIRRMCEQLGLEVARLRRTAIGSVRLGMLPAGKWRALEPGEVRALLTQSKITQKIAAPYIRGEAKPVFSPGRKKRSV